ncbi:2-keto-3-deoxy-phosphogluconate aldolase [Longilinea arvoryzae]|uniref:2-keto-3-deoxy-phosphogluconate aldolase n=1 Tax=Longilinea arvoryzae TaxID=360412 RepID=A0A0S7BE28_9CHLR|nr:bifunctional 4-hydroxy-2-oxoglutarate aldolase/2-dehydro-3-deoxy-phosphogluconate aldolase [Longilinea arvoryzae]GAP13152.1 2-keto-3-deoxy-phosphogluconate aldolase [Longilinea arvoryzae]
MDKHAVLARVKEIGLLAVIRGPSAELTVKMVQALVAGGVTGIEVTYSTPNAPWVVSELAKQYGDQILLGMGTLTRPAQAREAKAAGANFLVSPICEPGLVASMVASELAVMAGALTPTEVFQAYSLGTDVVKIFPGSLGGPAYMKALRGPFPDIPMMPTGGVKADNLKDWFKAGAVAVGAGSELCPKDLALAGRFEEISQRASEFAAAVRQARAEA